MMKIMFSVLLLNPRVDYQYRFHQNFSEHAVSSTPIVRQKSTLNYQADIARQPSFTTLTMY